MVKNTYKGKIHKLNKGKSYDMAVFYSSANRYLAKKHPVDKKKIWSLVFFLVNIFVIFVVLGMQLNSEEGISSISEIFKYNIRFKFLGMAILCFVIAN